MKLKHVSIAALLAAALASPTAFAQKTIKIGNTNPYSGPASAYGAIGKSIGAYWQMVNDQGGINGRKVEWISYDDGYSPPKTVEMTRRLVEQDQVLLSFQSLGTPPNSAIHKYMNAKKVPHLFVATGATKWNDPKRYPWTMGWQPNYQTEGRIYAEHILKNNPKAKIGIRRKVGESQNLAFMNKVIGNGSQYWSDVGFQYDHRDQLRRTQAG
jgi:branched-chain amino acid transport system substrate-binding protein